MRCNNCGKSSDMMCLCGYCFDCQKVLHPMSDGRLKKTEEDFSSFLYSLKLKGGVKMGKLILKTNIPRAKGMLYYLKNGDDGNLCVYEAVMSRGGRKKKVEKKIKK